MRSRSIATWFGPRPGLLRHACFLLTIAAGVQACNETSEDATEADAGQTGEPCGVARCDANEVCVEGQCVPPIAICVDQDGDGFGENCSLGDDCDDLSYASNPLARELCDEADNDCDFFVDEEGVCSPCVPTCTMGEAFCDGEEAIVRCDDSSGCARLADRQPCPSGLVCRGAQCVQACTDADRDGYSTDCGDRRDCDDSSAGVSPGLVERCDERDNNCNGVVDENFVCGAVCNDVCIVGEVACSEDGQSVAECGEDSAGCPALNIIERCPQPGRCSAGRCVTTVVCEDPDGDAFGPGCVAANDCRPWDAASNPSAAEVCDGIDNDCNALVDDGGACAACVPATVAAPAATVGGTLSRVACGGAEYIRLPDLGASTEIVALVSFSRGTGDVAIVDAASVATVYANGQDIGASQVVRSARSNRQLLRVTAPAGSRYLVSTATGVAADCSASEWDANNSPLAALDMGDIPAATPGAICGADLDYYSFSVLPGAPVAAALVPVGPQSGTTFVSIWLNGDEMTPATVTPSVGAAAWFRADLPGTYTVGARSLTSTGSGGYLMHVVPYEAASCTEDAGERTGGTQDDSLATARPFARGSTQTGQLCPGDYEVFSLGELGAGTNVAGLATLPDDVDVALFKANWRVRRDFPTNISDPGYYYLVVYGQTPFANGNWSVRRD